MKYLLKVSAALMLVCVCLFAGCGEKEKSGENTAVQTEVEVSVAEDAKEAGVEEATGDEAEPHESVVMRVGGLKGPTSIGLLPLRKQAENGETSLIYEFTMATAADEITTALVKGELDAALIPANVASILYGKTEGKIEVVDINTLGVLYMVSGDDSIKEPKDLKGKTIYLTGKGQTPDYVLAYVLAGNGISGDVSLEYKSEATEVAAVLSENPDAVGLIPQPFVTAACAKNEALKVVMSMDEEWNKLTDGTGSRLVTGVTVIRKDFALEHPKALADFIKDHKASTLNVNEDVDNAASLCVEYEIVAAEGIAKKAIPQCNITCITGNEMREALDGYLKVLYDSNPVSIGGQLPDEAFYYIEQ